MHHLFAMSRPILWGKAAAAWALRIPVRRVRRTTRYAVGRHDGGPLSPNKRVTHEPLKKFVHLPIFLAR